MSIDNPHGQDVLLKSKAIKARFGWSDATLWRKLRDPVLPFPASFSLGGPRLWREPEVTAWEIAKAAACADQRKRSQPTKPAAGHTPAAASLASSTNSAVASASG
jgi:predicted DNA-binding transcriptional regulator AlpA